MAFTCPICTYPKLSEQPRSEFGGGSYEICPSCGFQFGVDDDDEGYTYETWGKKWIAAGRPWSSKGIARPKGWPPPLKETPAAVAPAPVADSEKKEVKKDKPSSIAAKPEATKTPAKAKPKAEPAPVVKGAKPAKPAEKASAKPAGKTKAKTPTKPEKPAKKPAAKGPTKKSGKK